MKYNYHTHTARCRHASGSDEEYVIRAIEAEIKHLGFSDHAPFVFFDGYDDGYRIPIGEAMNYVESLRILRKKYANIVEIKIGFEMEYYPDYFEEMLDIARKVGAEYLILGQHFILSEHPNGIGAAGPTDNAVHLKIYVDEVIEAMRSGVFSYVAHPDLMCFTGDKDIYRNEITRLCLASKELDIPLEINLLGIRNKKHYPADEFWKIVGEIGSPVTIGYDAHASENFADKEQHIKANELIKKYSLNYIGMPKLRKIQ